jgi:hypothetical protein
MARSAREISRGSAVVQIITLREALEGRCEQGRGDGLLPPPRARMQSRDRQPRPEPNQGAHRALSGPQTCPPDTGCSKTCDRHGGPSPGHRPAGRRDWPRCRGPAALRPWVREAGRQPAATEMPATASGISLPASRPWCLSVGRPSDYHDCPQTPAPEPQESQGLHSMAISAISPLPIGTRLGAERKDCLGNQGLDPVFPCLRSFV